MRERLRTEAVAGTVDIEIKANIKGRRQVSKNKQAATAYRREKGLLSTETGAASVARIPVDRRGYCPWPTTAQAIGRRSCRGGDGA
ncbi:MAG TPA: hypothetical protein VGN63_15915 [Flavisolibacter sp.]|nr:hypothetical protein [Flavisolibacter sp.]